MARHGCFPQSRLGIRFRTIRCVTYFSTSNGNVGIKLTVLHQQSRMRQAEIDAVSCPIRHFHIADFFIIQRQCFVEGLLFLCAPQFFPCRISIPATLCQSHDFRKKKVFHTVKATDCFGKQLTLHTQDILSSLCRQNSFSLFRCIQIDGIACTVRTQRTIDAERKHGERD